MTIRNVNSATLKNWIDSGEAVIIDVREPAEHAAQKIEGSKLIPLSAISKQQLPDANGKKLVLHCGSGKRSTNACQKLLAEDPSLEIYNLEGGISAWNASGNAVESSDKFFLPLDRQVQLAIGLILITGSILGYIFTPALFLLTGFIGVGLTFAGLTGFCGMAIMMAKMPWNQSKGETSTTCCMR